MTEREDGDIGPGAMLARAREERRLSVAEVAEHLKYRVRQIEALEADDYSRLPESTIVRGMIRSYVKFVGMDPAPFLRALESRAMPTQAGVDLRMQQIPFPDRNKRATHLYVAFSVIVLLAIVVVLYEWHFSPVLPPPVVPEPPRGGASPAVAVIPAKTKAVVAAPPASPVVPAAPVVPEVVVAPPPAAEATPGTDWMPRIQLEFQRDSWVEIKDREGKVLLSQINAPGTEKVVQGEPPFSITIGNATGVRVTYKGAPVDLQRYMKSDVARLTLE